MRRALFLMKLCNCASFNYYLSRHYICINPMYETWQCIFRALKTWYQFSWVNALVMTEIVISWISFSFIRGILLQNQFLMTVHWLLTYIRLLHFRFCSWYRIDLFGLTFCPVMLDFKAPRYFESIDYKAKVICDDQGDLLFFCFSHTNVSTDLYCTCPYT